MTDKDKEAFNKWFETDSRSLYYGIEDIWQAACKYKQEEIDFLKDRNQTLISKVTSLNQVNDGLHLMLKESDKLEIENKRLRQIIEDLAQNGMDNEIATRLEELEQDKK